MTARSSGEGCVSYRRTFILSRGAQPEPPEGNVGEFNPLINSETPADAVSTGVSYGGSLAMTYFHWKYNQLSSAQRRFTVLFGMGRSGTATLWSPGLKGVEKQRLAGCDRVHFRFFSEVLFTVMSEKLHGYRIKLHEQLVSVSSAPRSACTSDLSTSWSRTTLQGGPASRKTYLQAGFPLRCFQRLSFPHIATRRCHWRDNRYTRGESIPVLSY